MNQVKGKPLCDRVTRGGFSKEAAFRMRLETLGEKRGVQFFGHPSPDGIAKALKLTVVWFSQITEREPM